MNAAPTALGLLVKTWPKLSETFILEEVLGLERQGRQLHLYTLEPPSDAVQHGAVDRVRAQPLRVPPAQWRHAPVLAGRHLQLLAGDPLRWLAAAAHALRHRTGAAFLRGGWLAVQLKRDGVPHLHSHFISTPSDVAEFASALSGRPFSISAHAKDIYLSRPDELKRKLGAAAFTVSCTDFNCRTLRALAPAADVRLMYHGIDASVFDPALRRPVQGPPLVLAVGRLRAKKGLDTLVDACALLHRRGTPFRCEIVGYGEEQAPLAQRIEDAGLLAHVTLVGKLTREQVVERYAGASVFVQPSRVTADGDRDGIPNVLLEAMAMGLPVVASRVSGIPELVQHGRNGLLVDPDDATALADAIGELLASPQRAQVLGRVGRGTVTGQFDNDRNLRLLSRLLAGVHGGAAPAATRRRVAYVMNGFPRLSETFIAHEILQLERLGQRLLLFSVKREDEPAVHPVVGAIRAPLHHLPEATSLSGSTLADWLRCNWPAFRADHAELLRRHPLRWLGTAATALGLAWRHRARDAQGATRLRKVYVKEFLQAGAIAAEVLRQGDVGHVHGHFCHGVATITWFASRLSALPFSFTAHAKDIYQPELNPGRLLERKMGAARFVATCTCANADVLRARHPRPAEVHAIYHGLDTDWFSPAAAPAPTLPTVLAVGRFVEKKGFDVLVDACARLAGQGLRFRCVIVGERGSAYDAIRRQIDACGLSDQVLLRPPVTQDALRDIYRQAHVFALPCQVMADGDRDGFPNVLAEAMAMGVPVVSTSISGIPEMIDDGVHGLLVPPRDAAALADALGRVLRDPALHARLAAAARERICERFDSRRTTVALHELFQAQLGRPAEAARADRAAGVHP